MKHKLKIITLLTLGALSNLVNAQVPNQPMQQVVPQPTNVGTTNTTVTTTGTKIEVPTQPTINDYSHLGEGNAYEKAVTPLLREISRKKSILELKKLDKEIAKLDEVEKKDATPTSNPFASMPPPVYPQQMKATAPITPVTTTVTSVEDMAILTNPVKVLMTYGDDNDLYAKIAVGDQGGYTVRKGDILPDGRTVLKVSSNYMEVEQAVKTKKSTKVKTQKIFVSAANSGATTTNNNTPNMGGSSVLPSSNMPTLATIPAANSATATTIPTR